jgi:pimeloyl-ACP methyl ester carboxylesterase
MASVDFEQSPDGARLAYQHDGPADDLGRCGFFWLGGFRSDMEGAKAEAMAGLARDVRRPNLRFDYSGHGKSDGAFEDGTISTWLAEARHMFTKKTNSGRVIVGSSMGGWLALLLARTLMLADVAAARRIAGIVLIAPAVDMTSDLMWDEFSSAIRTKVEQEGVYMRLSDYGEAYPITLKLLQDGANHLLLKSGFEIKCPVRILQGSADRDVPPSHALKVFGALSGPDTTLTLIKGGDHRLSTPGQLRLICETALRLAERADGIMP